MCEFVCLQIRIGGGWLSKYLPYIHQNLVYLYIVYIVDEIDDAPYESPINIHK